MGTTLTIFILRASTDIKRTLKVVINIDEIQSHTPIKYLAPLLTHILSLAQENTHTSMNTPVNIPTKFWEGVSKLNPKIIRSFT